ncbi:peroxisomal membrane protein PEX14 [Prosopis cineraria]|uniref:peroxisomal membrane protein PEX14 n=1 Tax=Prosopis cineraria TaxID=364024 RepID=UPI002410B3CC|nr:peroxisomal membrane protein PEX14 [Prosopis cineraria]
MATQSAAPPNTSDDKLRNPGPETMQPNVDQPQEEPVKQNSTSVFVNPQPMREEEVQNAVKFLSHPKVRGSPVLYRRSFLEKKGLTKEEIDEAFRRVPDSPPNVLTSGENKDGQLKTSSNVQQQNLAQTVQQGASTSTGTAISYPRFHWSQAIIAIGFLTASSAGTVLLIKNSFLPRLKSWIRKVVLEDDEPLKKIVSKPSLAEEAALAAKAAAAAAADVAKASQEMLVSQSEERRYFGELVSLVDKQVQEMKLMTNAIRRLEASSGAVLLEHEDHQVTQASSKQVIANGKVDYSMHSGSYSSTPASTGPSTAPHPKSYMEIMAMVQRGEKPSNIRDIDDRPPNPNQQPSNPRMAPRAKPWEVSHVQSTETQMLQPWVSGEDLNSKFQDTSIEVNGDAPVPWWQRKNVRISEIDDGNEHGAEPNGVPSSRQQQQPVRRTWVPPQPPPIAMPEAAEAIRRPKSVAQKEQVRDDLSAAHSSDMSDEVRDIPKTSESEGATVDSGLSSMPKSGEIQTAQEVN